MKKFLLVVLFAFAIIVFWASCTKKNEDELKKQDGITACDTVGMRYSSDVLPILQNNCYSCHANGNINGNVTLGSYAEVKQHVNDGLILNVITHAPGYPAMPYGLPKLSDCDINKITDWINHGAIND